MPTRKITRSPVKVTGTVPDGQEFESALEEDFFVLLRFNRLVESFEAQPVTIDWLDQAKKIRSYTPDVLVRYRNDLPESAHMKPELCEVKPDFDEIPQRSRRRMPARKEDEQENQLKWAAARRYAAKQGWRFRVVREKEIRTPYFANARFLLRYLERGKDSKYQAELLCRLPETGSIRLADWVGAFAHTIQERALVLPACYRLIAKQQVDVDLSVPLSLNSNVRALQNA